MSGRLRRKTATSETSSRSAPQGQVAEESLHRCGQPSHAQADRAEDVACSIRRALEFIAPEQLIMSSDCGFGRQEFTLLEIAFHKAKYDRARVQHRGESSASKRRMSRQPIRCCRWTSCPRRPGDDRANAYRAFWSVSGTVTTRLRPGAAWRSGSRAAARSGSSAWRIGGHPGTEHGHCLRVERRGIPQDEPPARRARRFASEWPMYFAAGV